MKIEKLKNKAENITDEARIVFTEHKVVMIGCFMVGFILGALLF